MLAWTSHSPHILPRLLAAGARVERKGFKIPDLYEETFSRPACLTSLPSPLPHTLWLQERTWSKQQVKAMEEQLLIMGTGRWDEMRAQVRGGGRRRKQAGGGKEGEGQCR